MAIVAPNPVLQIFDDTGEPLANGKVYTYDGPNTTTPKLTWQDAAETTPHANPIVLDSAGRATVYWRGNYRVDVKTSADVTVRTVQNFYVFDGEELETSLAGSGGSSLIGFLQSGAGAVARTVQAKLRDAISVQDYGVLGNGTDEGPAIQAAINAAGILKKNLFFPATVAGYRTGSKLTVAYPIFLVGESNSGSFIFTQADINPIEFTNAASGGGLRDIQILGPAQFALPTNQPGVVAINCHDLILSRAYVRKFKRGVEYQPGINSSYNCSINDSLIVENSEYNINALANSNALHVRNSQFGGGAQIGLRCLDSNSLNVIGGGVEGCTVAAIDIDATSTLSVGASIHGVHIEANQSSGGDIRIGNTATVSGVSITGNHFSPGAAAIAGVNAVRCNGLFVAGNDISAGYLQVQFYKRGTVTNDAVFSNGPANNSPIRDAYRYGGNLTDSNFDAATIFDANYQDSTQYNLYKINPGGIAAKNYYAGLDVARVPATSGTPTAGNKLYARACIGSNSYGSDANVRALLAGAAFDQTEIDLPYSASITAAANDGNLFTITATNATAFTINAPLNPVRGQVITYTIRNASGGAMGAVTWNAVFKLAAFTNPANSNSRSITFKYNGTNWIETSRTPSDVPN